MKTKKQKTHTHKNTKSHENLNFQSLQAEFTSKKEEKREQNQSWNRLLLPSFAVAAVFSFAIIWLFKTSVDSNMLLASVSHVSQQAEKIHINADIWLVKKENSYLLVTWKSMKKVEKIEGIIAFDPSSADHIISEDFIHFDRIADGVFRFSLDTQWKNIEEWNPIANLQIPNSPENLPILLSDTEFISEWQRYNLSNVVQ